MIKYTVSDGFSPVILSVQFTNKFKTAGCRAVWRLFTFKGPGNDR